MNKAAAASLGVVVAVCCACSEPDTLAEETPQNTSEASQRRPEASPDGEPAPGTSLTGRTALSGSVSGLVGEVSAFRVETTDTSTIVQLAADVLFAFDSATLGGQAPEQLRRAADLIRQGGAGDITIVGHTDAQGTDAYNDDLSRRRADAVAAWLASQGGVQGDRLKPEGRGEREPVTPNATADGQDSPSGRAKNRRVVLTIPRA